MATEPRPRPYKYIKMPENGRKKVKAGKVVITGKLLAQLLGYPPEHYATVVTQKPENVLNNAYEVIVIGDSLPEWEEGLEPKHIRTSG